MQARAQAHGCIHTHTGETEGTRVRRLHSVRRWRLLAPDEDLRVFFFTAVREPKAAQPATTNTNGLN